MKSQNSSNNKQAELIPILIFPIKLIRNHLKLINTTQINLHLDSAFKLNNSFTKNINCDMNKRSRRSSNIHLKSIRVVVELHHLDKD